MTDINFEILRNTVGDYNSTPSSGVEQEKTPDTELADALSNYKGYKPDEAEQDGVADVSADKATDLARNKRKYQLGRRVGNTRYIGTDSVYGGNNAVTLSGLQMHNGRITFGSSNRPSRFANTTDGYIGDSSQAQRGDCYFLAEINAIRNTKAGQQVLKQNCRKNKDGSYTVTLPGAKKIRNEYVRRGLECPITGTYQISKAALEKAGQSPKYSKGDLEVVAYELAMEAYREEMSLTQKLHGRSQHITAADGQRIGGGKDSADVLSGGLGYDAGFILTGQKSEVFAGNSTRYAKVKPYKDGKYEYISRQEMARRTGADVSMYYRTKSVGVSEVSSYTQNERAIDNMLNKYQGQEGNYALTVGVRCAENGPDGTTRAGGGHELTIVKITGDTVYVSNPWHPDKIEVIPRSEFVKMTTGLFAMPVNKPQNHQQMLLSGLLNYMTKK